MWPERGSTTQDFDPFYTTKRGKGGTGLGMHLVYNLVHQRLQGSIEIIDSPQGAAFRLELPQQLHQPFSWWPHPAVAPAAALYRGRGPAQISGRQHQQTDKGGK